MARRGGDGTVLTCSVRLCWNRDISEYQGVAGIEIRDGGIRVPCYQGVSHVVSLLSGSLARSLSLSKWYFLGGVPSNTIEPTLRSFETFVFFFVFFQIKLFRSHIHESVSGSAALLAARLRAMRAPPAALVLETRPAFWFSRWWQFFRHVH